MQEIRLSALNFSHCFNFPRDIPKIVLPLDNGNAEMFAFGLFSL